jgi:quercetin dioxygenase-like cupin family protein
MPRKAFLVGLLMFGVATSVQVQSAATSQVAAVQETSLQKVEVPNSNYEVVFDMMAIAAGTVPRHTHPGPTMVYILEGGFTLLMDGFPPRTFKAGDSFVEPTGVVHEGHSDKPSKIMVVFVVPKGSPLVTPAP